MRPTLALLVQTDLPTIQRMPLDFSLRTVLGMPATLQGLARAHWQDLRHRDPASAPTRLADHSYGCTAEPDNGSGGTLAEPNAVRDPDELAETA